jgi:hypothetical protein
VQLISDVDIKRFVLEDRSRTWATSQWKSRSRRTGRTASVLSRSVNLLRLWKVKQDNVPVSVIPDEDKDGFDPDLPPAGQLGAKRDNARRHTGGPLRHRAPAQRPTASVQGLHARFIPTGDSFLFRVVPEESRPPVNQFGFVAKKKSNIIIRSTKGEVGRRAEAEQLD